jgi:predicted nucleic acid-binding protein
MIVVSNSSPIISFSSIEKIDLLEKLFKEIQIPSQVYNEIKAKYKFGHEEIDAPFFKVMEIKNKDSSLILETEIDKGEAEAIELSLELKTDLLILDDRLGLKVAKNLGIRCIGTLSVLLIAQEKGYVKNVKDLLDEMIKKGRWYSPKVRNYFLSQIGEI